MQFVWYVLFSGLVDVNGCLGFSDFHRAVGDGANISANGEDQFVGIEGTPPDVQDVASIL